MAGEVKLTDVQRRMLSWYAACGPSSLSYGRSSTWLALLRRGLIARSNGLGVISTEITEAGREALRHGR